MATDCIIGIDLGTTNSAVAVARDGDVEVLPIHGASTMPSCVGIDPQGNLLVGQAAKNQLAASPESTIASVKRRMGESVKIPLGDRELAPEEISAFILREIKQEAERQLGEPVSKAVITVPAFFNERQRKATHMAGELAGLEVVRMINEPTAAALAYGAGQKSRERVLVYDLGGGTFDVSLVVAEDGVVEVKASHGDTHLGGDDFDRKLVDHAIAHFKETTGVSLNEDKPVASRLTQVMERAKRKLSDEPYTMVREEYLDGHHHLEMEVARIQYEELIHPLLDQTSHCVHRVLEDARVRAADLDRLLLVGGSTRTPLVRRLQQHQVGLEPHSEISPDLIVAMGAAIQGAIIRGETGHSILVDITPHTFSIETLPAGGDPSAPLVCTPILPRNTPLPASKSEAFRTPTDYQESVQVRVFQGELPLPEQNTLIGEFMVEGLDPVPAGNVILVHFALDFNGMLQVTATEKSTGLAKSVTLDTRKHESLDWASAQKNVEALGRTKPRPKVESATRAALPEATGAESPEPEGVTTAQKLRKQAESVAARDLNPDDRQELESLLSQLDAAIESKDSESLQTTNEALSNLLFFLEE